MVACHGKGTTVVAAMVAPSPQRCGAVIQMRVRDLLGVAASW